MALQVTRPTTPQPNISVARPLVQQPQIAVTRPTTPQPQIAVSRTPVAQPPIAVNAPNPQPNIFVDNSPRFVRLGEAVKAKYPGIYDSVDNGVLGKMVATKYPNVYDSLIDPATTETTESEPQGTSGLKGVGLGFVKEVGQRLNTISGLGQKALQKITGIEQPVAQINPQSLEQKGFAEKVGGGIENIAEFLVPAGAVSKVGKVVDAGVQGLNYGSKATKTLQLAGKVGLGATEASGITAFQGGDKDEIKNAAIFGGAFPIALKAISKIGNAVKEVAKFTSSSLSGVPKEAIEYALKNPQKVQTAIKTAIAEGGDTATQRIYTNVLNAFDELKNARRLNYQSGLQKLEKEATYTKNGQLYIKRVLTDAEAKATKGYVAGTPIGVPTNLTTGGIKKVATTTLKEFDIKAKGRLIDWNEAAIDNSHGKKLQELVDRIYDWSDTTPTGLNRLRKIVDGYKIGGIELSPSQKQVNAIIGAMRTVLSEYVGTRVPQIAEMNLKYKLESELIDNVRKQLKIGSADPNTALRKLLNIFNPKSQVYRPIVEQLGEKTGKDLMSDLAALTMVQWTPEGLGKYLTGLTSGAGIGLGFVNPAALATLPVTAAASSPRITGKVYTGIGKINKTKTAETIKKSAPTVAKGFGTVVSR